MAEIEIGYVGEIEQSWGVGAWAHYHAGRRGVYEARRSRKELTSEADLGVDPKQVVCDDCHLYYWGPLGACPECA